MHSETRTRHDNKLEWSLVVSSDYIGCHVECLWFAAGSRFFNACSD